MLGILCWSSVVSDVFVESNNIWLILNQNLYRLSSLKLDGFTGGNFSSKVINHFSLSLWIFGRIKSQILIILNKVPVKLYSIINSLVKTVLLDSKQRTFNCSLQCASSSNWLAGVQSSWRLNIEDFLDRLEEKRDSGSTSNKFYTVKLNVFGL